MKKEKTEKTEKTGKTKKTSKTLIYVIGGVLIALLAFIVYWKFEQLKLDFSELAMMTPGEIAMAIVGIIILAAMAIGMEYLLKKKPDIGKKVEESVTAFWRLTIIPFMVIIIMFLGWLHNKYQYTSTFRENVTQTMCSLGNATMTIYNAGVTIPWWAWIFIWGGLFYFGIDAVIDIWKAKRNKKGEIIDDLNNENKQ